MNAKTTNKKYLVLKYAEYGVFALVLLLAFVGVLPLGTNTGYGIF